MKKVFHIGPCHPYIDSYSESIYLANLIETEVKHYLFIPNLKAVQTHEWTSKTEKHILDMKNFLEEVSVFIEQHNPDLIVFHSIAYHHDLELIIKYGKLIKIAWVIWGWDLYSRLKNEESIKVLQLINENISFILGYSGDYKILQTQIKNPASFVKGSDLIYSIPSLSKIKSQSNNTAGDYIILGNSGDPGNNHIEIISEISKKSDYKNYLFIIPMSYSATADYIERVDLCAKTQGLNYHILINFISPSEYENIIQNAMLLVTCHNRQQSAGTIITALSYGVPVILREKITVEGYIFENPIWESLKSFKVNLLDWENFKEFDSLKNISICENEDKSNLNHFKIYYSSAGAAQRLIFHTNHMLYQTI